MSNQVSLKLLIDKKGKRILYGEADKKFIDFLFTILALPVGTVISLLSNEPTLGPLSNLYRSVNSLNISYFEENQNKDTLLKPKLTVTKSQVGNLLQIESSSATKIYRYCSGTNCRKYFTATSGSACPECRNPMYSTAEYVYGADEIKSKERTGYVKGMVTYMVMDDLTVKPMSSISTISVLNALSVDAGQIEQKLIHLDMKEGVKLLRASLHSANVLTDVFLHKIDFSTHDGSNLENEERDELAQGSCHLLFASHSHLFKCLVFIALFYHIMNLCYLFLLSSLYCGRPVRGSAFEY